MKRVAVGIRLGIIAAALAVAGCGEVTEPVDVVEVRVAHAAPGLGTQVVHLNGQAFTELSPLGHVFFALQDAPATYAFTAAGDTVRRSVTHEESVNAIVLMNAAAPEVHYFPLERVFGEVRIAVINGDFETSEPMIVRVEGPQFEFEEAIAPGAQVVMNPGPGPFDVRVRPGGEEGFIQLQSFTLVHGDHGFLILVRDPGAEAGFRRLLF